MRIGVPSTRSPSASTRPTISGRGNRTTKDVPASRPGGRPVEAELFRLATRGQRSLAEVPKPLLYRTPSGLIQLSGFPTWAILSSLVKGRTLPIAPGSAVVDNRPILSRTFVLLPYDGTATVAYTPARLGQHRAPACAASWTEQFRPTDTSGSVQSSCLM
jgi:hypothetical protein